MTDTTRHGLEALRIATRPALVDACGRAALATLAGVALLLSVWKGLPLTASVIAAGGLMTGALRLRGRRQPEIRVSTTDR
jgi:hypothetical protein